MPIPGIARATVPFGGQTIPEITNLPLHYHPVSPWGGLIQRGVIIDQPGNTRLYFQYNPDRVRVTYEALNTVKNDEAQNNQNIEDKYFTNGIGFGFNIFFDRRLDYYAIDPTTGRPNAPNGVIKDIEVLQKLMGIRMTKEGPQGVARQKALLFIFGGSNDGSPVSMTFSAFITNLTVDYTHFSPEMIPLVGTATIAAAIRTRTDAVPPPGPSTVEPAPAGPAPPPPPPPPETPPPRGGAGDTFLPDPGAPPAGPPPPRGGIGDTFLP